MGTTIGYNLAKKTLDKLNTTDKELATQAKSKIAPIKSMSLYLTDASEIAGIIRGLKTNSAPGWDNINSSIIKTFCHFLAEPISYLCNLSIEHGVFPVLFKSAIFCPIHKTGDKCQPTNYRPISLLTVLSKILEKTVNKRLVNYVESNNLLSPNQYGFRSNKSTEDAVLNLTSRIATYLP